MDLASDWYSAHFLFLAHQQNVTLSPVALCYQHFPLLTFLGTGENNMTQFLPKRYRRTSLSEHDLLWNNWTKLPRDKVCPFRLAHASQWKHKIWGQSCSSHADATGDKPEDPGLQTEGPAQVERAGSHHSRGLLGPWLPTLDIYWEKSLAADFILFYLFIYLFLHKLPNFIFFKCRLPSNLRLVRYKYHRYFG